MKYEKTTILKGALQSPAYIEKIDTVMKSDDTETLYLNGTIVKDSDRYIDTNVIISQLIRLTSLLTKVVDLSTLPQEQQDSINELVLIFEAYPTMGDQMLATDGRIRVETAMQNQEKFAENYADVKNEPIIDNPYEGSNTLSHQVTPNKKKSKKK
jgi:hypothetical protein